MRQHGNISPQLTQGDTNDQLHGPKLWQFAIVCAVGLLLLNPSLWADSGTAGTAPQFLYVNDTLFFNATNQVEGFRVSPAGTLTALPGSPFLTGGKSSGAASYAGRNLLATPNGKFLYAGNQGSGDISVFTVNPNSGALTVSPIRYLVFPNLKTQVGATLAMTPNGKFLFAASGSLYKLQTFFITPNGALQYASVPLPRVYGNVLDMVVTRDGKFLLVTDEYHDVRVFSVGLKGALAEVPGSPFPTSGMGSGMTLDCSGHHLYLGDSQQTGTSAEVLSIGSDGTLTPLPGSPFEARLGNNSNTVILSADGKFLYVGNQYSTEVSSFSVADDASLTVVPNSPFFDGNFGDQPSQMSLNRTGGFLFVVGTPYGAFPSVDVFKTSTDGTLETIPQSPFFLDPNADPVSLVTMPAPTCTP
jgi:6-phosphogluconolactonase (cycloisomerase 2 family)